MRIVLASNNAGKLRELRALLEPLGVRVVAQGELGIAETDEPHPSFVENALAKARHASRESGLPAIAECNTPASKPLATPSAIISPRFDCLKKATNCAAKKASTI